MNPIVAAMLEELQIQRQYVSLLADLETLEKEN